ncbi:hypothetical protein AVEN_167831-1 [Araneus ventricosus]|uniref:Serine-threonine/tyrosine-protein kinase catalytic domain-containing protein n=1 Tax=Araneus ventricosus TaxID=182803 RepID=A0A4Y1ZUT6_ARAVE|nr:hypothetical protein AVEN_265619-1 [Araneus ventricosus]GBL67850.1 hypothetical protein AVEN_116061-1 [Araneus ventricosus]GBL67874.1 hypothetical protein AVEN_153518-1 [Araneus ventricosus]GBL67896.1 hypothetical protein AVEN_167831-1 [Araneus ventricosus]
MMGMGRWNSKGCQTRVKWFKVQRQKEEVLGPGSKGLSRDIYEHDYYSSDNKKTELPVKWMAPESLEKGTYFTKTVVVSPLHSPHSETQTSPSLALRIKACVFAQHTKCRTKHFTGWDCAHRSLFF